MRLAHVNITLPGDGGTYTGAAAVALSFVPDPSPTPPDPSPPPHRPVRAVPGVHDRRSPDEVKAEFPGTVLTREFIAGVQTTPKSLVAAADRVCRPSWAVGLMPVYGFKLDPAQVAAGKWDGPLAELAAWHSQQPDAYIVPWHEPEDDLAGADFARLFNRVADTMRAANPFVRMVYSAMGYQWAPSSRGGSIAGRTNTPADWRAVNADFLAVDVYSGRSFPLRAILPEHPGFKRWVDEVVGDRTYMVTERGFETANDHLTRAEQIRREVAWLAEDPQGQRCTGWIYWNTVGTESSSSLLLDTVHGEPALRDAVARLAALD